MSTVARAGTSVKRRIALWNVCILALVLALLGIAFRMTIRASLTADLDRDMALRASRATTAWEELTPIQQAALVEAARLRRLGVPGGVMDDGLPARKFTESVSAVLGLSADNAEPDMPIYSPKILSLDQRDFVTGEPSSPRDAIAFARAARGASSFSTVDIWGHQARVYSTPIHRGGQVVGVLQLARSLFGVRRTVQTITGTLLMFIPAALLVAWLGGLFLTDRAIRPVRKLRQATQRIEASRLSERLTVTGDDEFAELSSTLNQMLARLETSFTQQQRFTADASHELRTPLTVIRGNASLALAKDRSAEEYRESIVKIARVTETMAGTVDSLLLLARADAGELRRGLSAVNIGDVLDAARSDVSVDAAAPISIDISDPSMQVLGNFDQLTRVFSNLLINSIRHTPSDGSVKMTAGVVDGAVVVTVQDTGEGIAPEHLPHLGERFYRVDAARTGDTGGTGLGLAICRSIVDAHNGDMHIESQVGVGTTVRVTLPRA